MADYKYRGNQPFIPDAKPPTPPAPRTPGEAPECGTTAGYTWHRTYGEPIDEECRYAWNAYFREYRERKKAAKS